MAHLRLAIMTQFVRSFLTVWGQDICWPQSVLSTMRRLTLDMADVLHVMERGDVTSCEKETCHGAIVVIEGDTCDGSKISVEVWIEVYAPILKVRSISIV